MATANARTFVGPSVALPFVALAAGVITVAPAENIPNGIGGGGQRGQLGSGAAMMATITNWPGPFGVVAFIGTVYCTSVMPNAIVAWASVVAVEASTIATECGLIPPGPPPDPVTGTSPCSSNAAANAEPRTSSPGIARIGVLTATAFCSGTLGICASAVSANAATQIQKPITASHLCFSILPPPSRLNLEIREPPGACSWRKRLRVQPASPKRAQGFGCAQLFSFLKALVSCLSFCFHLHAPFKGICDGPALPHQVLVFHCTEIEQHAKLNARVWKWQ
jgi:hypothetical protein